MAIAYAIMLIVAIVLLVLYCTLIHKKEKWLIVFFSCVPIVNFGYLLLSLSQTVECALLANKVAYLGHVFLLISMYLTITRLCGFNYKKSLPIVLISVGIIMFAIVCTTGYLPWYYKDVTLEFADGAAKLIKTYGPLHPVYLVYVLAYFVLMIVTIIHSICVRKTESKKHAGLLAAVVLCNIAMWIIEKFIPLNFEFLSVSYILSEGMLFFLYWMMQDYVHKDEVAPIVVEEKKSVVVVDSIPKAEKIKIVVSHVLENKMLTQRQLDMLSGILDGKSRKEIAAEFHISENTVKMHMSLLYENLGVSGKEEIFAFIYGDKK